MPDIRELNSMPETDLASCLERCCGSSRWVAAMVRRRPFSDSEDLFSAAEAAAAELSDEDWLEAFSHHPKIGDVESLRSKFASTRQWSAGEQRGVESADEEILRALARGNAEYENRFGFIFIVCATGKGAREMLSILEGRLGSTREQELLVASGEQRKITRIRLEKLIS